MQYHSDQIAFINNRNKLVALITEVMDFAIQPFVYRPLFLRLENQFSYLKVV